MIPELKALPFKAFVAAFEDTLGMSLSEIGKVNHKLAMVEVEGSKTGLDGKDSAIFFVTFSDKCMECFVDALELDLIVAMANKSNEEKNKIGNEMPTPLDLMRKMWPAKCGAHLWRRKFPVDLQVRLEDRGQHVRENREPQKGNSGNRRKAKGKKAISNGKGDKAVKGRNNQAKGNAKGKDKSMRGKGKGKKGKKGGKKY